MSNAIKAILAERNRQIVDEGFTAEHDDEHVSGELAAAAACYANPMSIVIDGDGIEIGEPNTGTLPLGWPESWDAHWWKPEARRASLIKAGALIIAEIERIDRELNMDRCEACNEALREGDQVYWSTDGGYLHAECLGSDPENFTDSDGNPLKPGDPIPSSFAYGDDGEGAGAEGVSA